MPSIGRKNILVLALLAAGACCVPNAAQADSNTRAHEYGAGCGGQGFESLDSFTGGRQCNQNAPTVVLHPTVKVALTTVIPQKYRDHPGCTTLGLATAAGVTLGGAPELVGLSFTVFEVCAGKGNTLPGAFYLGTNALLTIATATASPAIQKTIAETRRAGALAWNVWGIYNNHDPTITNITALNNSRPTTQRQLSTNAFMP